MQNTFGLKDLLLYALVALVGVVVLLAMVQDDRLHEQLLRANGKLDQHESALAQIQRELHDLAESGVAVRGPAGAAAPGGRDESWARPGVPVVWPEPYRDASDPTRFPEYAEGGEFVEIFEAQPAKMTPYLYQDVYGRRVIEQLVCESLGELDAETLELRGLLAEAWQYDPAGEWLRVKINDRARFSDGLPVTAEDVRFTHEFVMDPRHDTERFRASINKIDRVEVISERVAEFHFTEPAALNKMHTLRSLPIIPRHFYSRFTPTQFNNSTGLLMGSGPYKLETLDPDNQWAPPQDVVIVRNENYWGPRPAIDRHRFTVVSGNTARLTAFLNGTGHMMRATPIQFRDLTADPDFTAENHAFAWQNMRSGYFFIAWQNGPRNGKLTPFHDARVRRAMTHLINREHMVNNFYYGQAKIAAGPFPPGSPMQDPAVEPWPYDPRRAVELLAEAGWLDRDGDGFLENVRGDRFVFEFTHSQGGSISPRLAKYLKDECAKIGVTMNINVVDWSIYGQIMDDRNYDAIALIWSHALPEIDPFQLWHSESIDNRGDNHAQFRNARADELIERGRAELDDDERMEIWRELYRLIHEEQPYTFLANPPWFRFVTRDVANVHVYPRGLSKTEMFFPAGD
jgi:peptide/nickel transport system substrate-binding protein